MAEVPVKNIGNPKCPGCNRVPPPEFDVQQRLTVHECTVCDTTFVVIEEATQYKTLEVHLTPAEPPPE